MDMTPPAGSLISVRYDEADPIVIIPARASASRYFGGVFLLFWLGMWTFGFSSAFSQIVAGNAQPFLIIWLCGWTVGGCAAVFSAYRIFRPAIPESLTLKRGSIVFDSGIQPLEYNMSNRGNYWKSLFAKRIRSDISKPQLQSLRLRETENGNRLTLDLGAQRIDIASKASEVEREWLARLLAQRYALTNVLGNEVAPTG